MNFERGDARPAGHMFVVPAPLVHFGDRKPKRPFLLLARCTEGAIGNLALMTTKATERLYGATLLEFTDQRGKLGFPDQESSYVNLSALTFYPASGLNQSIRSYARLMPVVRAALKTALGIGTGLGTGAPGESLRGFIVRLSNEMAGTFGFIFAIVVTEHRYSAGRRKQAVVPIVDATAFLTNSETLDDFRQEPGDVLPSKSAGWLRQLPGRWTMPVVDTARLTSFSHGWRHGPRPETWLEAQIEHVYDVPVDVTTLVAIESALTARLKLP